MQNSTVFGSLKGLTMLDLRLHGPYGMCDLHNLSTLVALKTLNFDGYEFQLRNFNYKCKMVYRPSEQDRSTLHLTIDR